MLRWRERVSPAKDATVAGAELMAFLATAVISAAPPPWLGLATTAVPAALFASNPAWQDVVAPLERSGGRITVLTFRIRAMETKRAAEATRHARMVRQRARELRPKLRRWDRRVADRSRKFSASD